jgi:VWFA-related protein
MNSRTTVRNRHQASGATMRDRLCRLTGGLAVMLFSFVATGGQSPPVEKPRLKNFGSSLKRLKWDAKKQSAVEIKARVKPGETDGDDVVRIETNLVVCDVQVRDRRGSVVTGLTRDDFIITEDAQPQNIQHLSLGNDQTVGRSIVLLIDYSGSELPYLNSSLEAAKILIDQPGPQDTMAVVTDDVELLVDFTRDKEKLKKSLDSLRKRAEHHRLGRSRQFSALMATVREMFTREDIRPIIIFQTDGDEVFLLQPSNPPVLTIPTAPRYPNGPRIEPRQTFSLRDVYLAIEKSRASVYTIIPGPQRIQARSEKDLNLTLPRPGEDFTSAWLFWGNIAAAGAAIGGWTAYFSEPEDAKDIYAKVLADINSRYVIGYYPTNKMHDGKRRTVVVEVRHHPEYSVAGRKSYIAPDLEP